MSYIYMDHNSSTPMTPEVREEYLRVGADFGNPSARHAQGLHAMKSVTSARHSLCGLLHCSPSEFFFTSGGTESNITAVESMISQAMAKGTGEIPRLVVGAGEHASILVYLEQAQRLNRVRVEILSMDQMGQVSPSELDALLPGAAGLCLMWANNETGTCTRMNEVAERVQASQVPWHCDGVQAVGKVQVNLGEGPAAAISTFSLSGHKINGPRGVGALFVRSGVAFTPLFPSHQQENGRRAGTENVAGISAFGVAGAQVARRDQIEMNESLGVLRDALSAEILAAFPGSRIHGDPEARLHNTLFMSLCQRNGQWIDGEEVALELAHRDIAVSTGAACESGSGKPSHVLLAMGCAPAMASASLRFSLGVGNDASQIPHVLKALQEIIPA